MRKALSAYKIAVTIILLLFFFRTEAQTKCNNNGYEIINAIFNSGEAKLYETTLFNKGWAHYFEGYDEIFKNVGIPTLVSDDELQTILGDIELRIIHSRIYGLRPCLLSYEDINEYFTISDVFA